MRYPRSFLKLLLAGFILVALPLVAALVTSAIAVNSIANRSQSTVYRAVQATQTSRRLAELLTAMERSARQVIILNDRGLLSAYDLSRAQFADTAAEFSKLSLDYDQRAELDAIVKAERQIHAALSDVTLSPAVLRAAVEQFDEMSRNAGALIDRSGKLIDREVEAMRKSAIDTQRIMLWQSLSLFPVIIFLVIGFTLLIVRPVRQIDAAIRNLGDGQLNVPISVSGPEDLEYLGERLEWMRRQFIDTEQQKNRFLQQVAHELKTPLTALREGAQLLSDDVVGKLTPEQREIAQILRQNSIELQRRIEELLNYGAMQFHKLMLQLVSVDPGQIFDRVAENHKLALNAKNLVLQVQREAGKMQADAEKLRVVFDNLLSNAIKFSPSNGTIAVDMRYQDAKFTFDICDDGPGIADADRTHIFEPFFQGRVQGTGAVKGSGLGLSIVKEYVAAHSGLIMLISAPRGAHFRVTLPLQQTSDA